MLILPSAEAITFPSWTSSTTAARAVEAENATATSSAENMRNIGSTLSKRWKSTGMRYRVQTQYQSNVNFGSRSIPLIPCQNWPDYLFQKFIHLFRRSADELARFHRGRQIYAGKRGVYRQPL